MKQLRIDGRFHTDAGERNNEDSSLVMIDNGIILFGVADGVGGLDDGELASGYITSSLEEWFKKHSKEMETLSSDEIKNLLHDHIMQMHENLKLVSREKKTSVGSTLTFAIIKGNSYIIAHIGDSRAYMYQNGTTKMLTKDQTVYQKASDRGEEIPEDKAKRMQSMLLQCMGYGKVVPCYYEGILPEEYAMLICSDGLSNTLKSADFTRELSKEGELHDSLVKLTKTARGREEQDNITSACVKRAYVEM